MKFGMNLMLWADDMDEGLVPVLESLREIGYDGVEIPVFDLDRAKWAAWAHRLDGIGLARTANHVIAPEFNPVSPDATFEALHAVGYDGWLTVESFGNALPNLAAATKIWRQLFDSPDQVAREGFAFMQRKAAEYFPAVAG